MLSVLFICTIIQLSNGGYPSGRTVYNLHTRPTHWASARATCAGYDAHLVTVESASTLEANLQTLDLLDWDGAFGRLIQTGSVWTGLYRSTPPDHTAYLAWDTCRTFTAASAPNTGIHTDLVTGADSCASMADGYRLEPRACDQELPFICQMELGQCWFLPLEGQAFVNRHNLEMSGDLHECAKECRNHISAAGECWGFEVVNGECRLYLDVTSHVFIRDSALHLTSDPGNTAYVKICTGGWQTSTASVHSAVIQEPPFQNCSAVEGDDWNSGICYCDCEKPPTVLSPDYLLSSPEEKTEEITAELLVDPTETSKAQRKLSSAEDPRPSAKSMGGFGIAVLTLVFGGIIILDLSVLIQQIKKFAWKEEQTT